MAHLVERREHLAGHVALECQEGRFVPRRAGRRRKLHGHAEQEAAR